MTPNPIAAAALGYAGPRRTPHEATGPMTGFGREPATAQSTERTPVTPDRP